jgi:hypothetical protein
MENKMSLIETTEIPEKIQIILRQTNYTPEEAIEKLKQYNFNEISVIKAYLGIVEKTKTTQKTLNQEIYTQLRHRLDSNMRDYNKRVEKGEARKL